MFCVVTLHDVDHKYLGVTHAILIALQIDCFQDDLGGLLRLARLWDGIGAQNFVSAFGPRRHFRAVSCVCGIGIWAVLCGCSRQTEKSPH